MKFTIIRIARKGERSKAQEEEGAERAPQLTRENEVEDGDSWR